jgi:hypothetical protein
MTGLTRLWIVLGTIVFSTFALISISKPDIVKATRHPENCFPFTLERGTIQKLVKNKAKIAEAKKNYVAPPGLFVAPPWDDMQPASEFFKRVDVPTFTCTSIEKSTRSLLKAALLFVLIILLGLAFNWVLAGFRKK